MWSFSEKPYRVALARSCTKWHTSFSLKRNTFYQLIYENILDGDIIVITRAIIGARAQRGFSAHFLSFIEFRSISLN